MSKYIFDVVKNDFLPEHTKIYDDLYETTWKESEPQYFGPDIHPAIRFSHFEFKPIGETVKQRHRKGGRAADVKPVWRSIAKGFKFTHLPPAELRVAGMDYQLTGDTRKEYFAKLGREYYICAIFVPVAGATQYEIEDAISVMGQTLQEEPASNPNTMEDVKSALSNQCSIFKKSKGKAGVNPHDLDSLLARTKIIGSRFSEQKQADIAYGVFNHYNEEFAIASWSSNAKAAYRIESYLKRFQLVDSEKVVYICAAASTVSKVFTRAIAKAAEHPDKEIRVVFHTSTLTGGDPQKSFETVAGSNIEKFNQMCTNARHAFNGDGSNPISVYGVLPAVGGVHSFDEPVLYNPKSNSLYQRKHGYIYVIDEDEVSESDYE